MYSHVLHLEPKCMRNIVGCRVFCCNGKHHKTGRKRARLLVHDQNPKAFNDELWFARYLLQRYAPQDEAGVQDRANAYESSREGVTLQL